MNVMKVNIIIFGYRGYGKSQGVPSEKGLYLDAEAIVNFAFDDLSVLKYVDKDNVYVFGRSLGGAVAINVAVNTKMPIKGLIIENTFSTMGDLVDRMFPIIKKIRKYLLKSKYESINLVKEIKIPVLFCRSENDELIPKEMMDKLYDECRNCRFKEYYVIKGGNHNDGFRTDMEGYSKVFKNFMKKCGEKNNKPTDDEKEPLKM